jgi:hypothetical protein
MDIKCFYHLLARFSIIWPPLLLMDDVFALSGDLLYVKVNGSPQIGKHALVSQGLAQR